MSKPLTFVELEIGEYFIGFPSDGDDAGHGGYRNGSYVFQKKKNLPGRGGNARRVIDGNMSSMPQTMQVYKVIL